MADEMTAAFEKTYPGGPTIDGTLRLPVGRSHGLVLFGPSGSGKTTVLRCLAGLERPTSGRILFAGETWFDADAGIHASPQVRKIGYLCQDYALFPHLTVQENIAYGLRGGDRGERDAVMRELICLLQLDGLEARRPAQLSGGQQQRVALARALARRPRLLLLDEPLSALDAPTREHVRGALRRLLRSQGIPAICVTHDRDEALALADEVAVMERGRVREIGLPERVLFQPSGPDMVSEPTTSRGGT